VKSSDFDTAGFDPADFDTIKFEGKHYPTLSLVKVLAASYLADCAGGGNPVKTSNRKRGGPTVIFNSNL
jgi:hypothetical protein